MTQKETQRRNDTREHIERERETPTHKDTNSSWDIHTDKTKLSLIGRLGVGNCGNVGIANN